MKKSRITQRWQSSRNIQHGLSTLRAVFALVVTSASSFQISENLIKHGWIWTDMYARAANVVNVAPMASKYFQFLAIVSVRQIRAFSRAISQQHDRVTSSTSFLRCSSQLKICRRSRDLPVTLRVDLIIAPRSRPTRRQREERINSVKSSGNKSSSRRRSAIIVVAYDV